MKAVLALCLRPRDWCDPLLLTIVVRLLCGCRCQQFSSADKCNDFICACWSDQASSLPACEGIRKHDYYKPDVSCAIQVDTVCAAHRGFLFPTKGPPPTLRGVHRAAAVSATPLCGVCHAHQGSR